MVDMERDARFAPVAEFGRRRMLQVGVASFLAAGMLAARPIADARTTQIQILSRTTAFGGYSFPGVGQYEVITGIATGEVNPNDPQERGDHRHRARAENRKATSSISIISTS